jgi:hypothetical protein
VAVAAPVSASTWVMAVVSRVFEEILAMWQQWQQWDLRPSQNHPSSASTQGFERAPMPQAMSPMAKPQMPMPSEPP